MSNNKRIAKNTIMLYIRMIVSTAIGLYTSRVVLSTLGVIDFGIYNVVAGFVIMFSFLNTSMSASTQRFLTFELGRRSVEGVNKIFNLSLLLHVCIALFIIILSETIGLWFLNTKLVIPLSRLEAANWVYQFSILILVLNIIFIPYDALIIAYEKMSFYAYASIIVVVLKLVVVYILLISSSDTLILYSILSCLVILISKIIYIVYCLYSIRNIELKFYWNYSKFKELTFFAGWNLLGVFAGIGKNQGISVVLNMFFGPIVNTARGLSYQVVVAINQLVANLQLAYNPSIVKYYASGENGKLYNLVFGSSRYSFFLLLIVISPLLLLTNIVLGIWLDEVPKYTVMFTRLILIDSLICSLSGSIQTLVQASGNIRIYQIIISGILLLNVPVSVIILNYVEYPEIVFFVSILLSLIAFMLRLVVVTKIHLFPLKMFIKDSIYPIVKVSLLALIINSFIYIYISKEYWYGFIIVCLLSFISNIIVIYFFGLNHKEHIFFLSIFNKYLKYNK